MPKRKRNAELSLSEKLTKHQDEIFRALKAAKGFERQRLAKRTQDEGVTPEKLERLEREINVLKSLDLHQTARAHLSASLLKVKAIATSTDLPEEIKAGVPKLELTAEEKTAFHNVTSGLYSRKPVKQAVERAVEFVCDYLKVPPPGQGKQAKKPKGEEQDEQPADRIRKDEKRSGAVTEVEAPGEEEEVDIPSESDFEGFQSDVDEPGPAIGEPDSEADAEEENELSKLDDMLGSSSDDEDDFASSKYDKFRGKETANLDDISVSGADSDSEDEQPPPTKSKPSRSPSPSPPPAKKKKKTKKEAAPVRDSTFLPSLMGGYISGSESASDIEVAPPKKRRGQRARQAIAEKKYGANAKHLLKQQQQGRGRDAGWDMKRGAVDGDDQGRRTPWKRGVGNVPPPRGREHGSGSAPAPAPKPTKRDDQGVLHPSWQAAKLKESQQAATFSGQKITFD